MIVTQSDYMRWQHMYSTEGKGVEARGAEGKGAEYNTSSSVNERQSLAMAEAESGNDQQVAAGQSKPDFIQSSFEKLLANRLGIDQEKMEELKEEIEKTELAIDDLKEQQPLNTQQKKELNALEERLEMLKSALEELVKQGSERTNEKETAEQKQKQLIREYQSVASII